MRRLLHCLRQGRVAMELSEGRIRRALPAYIMPFKFLADDRAILTGRAGQKGLWVKKFTVSGFLFPVNGS